jgi:phosphoserine phosphatase RsbU/P
VGFVLGDVSGKGLGAALFMAITRTIVRATALRGVAPATCIRAVNHALFPECVPQMFVTLVYGVLDPQTGSVALCNAGHHRPFVVRSDGRVEVVAGMRNLAVCLKSDFDYTDTQIALQPGESLVVYSDGVTEAVDGHRAQFDEARLMSCLARSQGERPAEIIRNVLRAVAEFCGSVPPADDSTMLVLQYTGERVAFTQEGIKSSLSRDL